MEKELKIQVPNGYEIDEENSTFGCIKFKEKKEIRTWEDFTRITNASNIEIYPFERNNMDDKFIKHLIAEMKIRKLMPYYGGEITKEEWKDNSIHKYVLEIFEEKIINNDRWSKYTFLAFHTRKQRDEFIKYNEQLIKDYFMLND